MSTRHVRADAITCSERVLGFVRWRSVRRRPVRHFRYTSRRVCRFPQLASVSSEFHDVPSTSFRNRKQNLPVLTFPSASRFGYRLARHSGKRAVFGIDSAAPLLATQAVTGGEMQRFVDALYNSTLDNELAQTGGGSSG